MMFRRPSQRVKCPPAQNVGKPKPGTFLYNLMTPGEVECFTFKKGPVYKKEEYLRLLQKNHENLGIPYVKPDLPEPTPYVPPEKPSEPRLEFGDQVYVTLRILKSGIVRVKVSCAIAMMYEKYYRHGSSTTLQDCPSGIQVSWIQSTIFGKNQKKSRKKDGIC
jgi:hypothetical protein